MHGKTILARWAAVAGLLFAGPLSWGATPPEAELAAIEALRGAYARSVVPGDEAGRYRELLATALQRLKRSSAADVDLAALAHDVTRALESLPASVGDPEKVFAKAMDAAAASMRALDPHARYIDPRRLATERSEMSGSFGGLGLQVEPSDNAVRIVSLMPDSPAARSSALAPGDLIVRVDDEPLTGMPLADAIARMRGQPGTPVSLTVQRGGQAAPITVALTRETIRRQLLRMSVEGDVLVLRLGGFGPTASSAIAQAVEQATAAAPAPKALVLDLRGNPGGLLHEAVRVADAFLNAGEIVSLRNPASTRSRAWRADAGELLAGVPMVVLVDGRSASASELVADALQHHGRATVMGQRSFGKGSVQTTLPLGPDSGAVKLTTSLYYGPSGQTVHRVGVAPDIELLSNPPAADVSRSGSGAGVQAADASPSPRRARARVDPARCADAGTADAALSCAIDYLRSGSFDAFLAKVANNAP